MTKYIADRPDSRLLPASLYPIVKAPKISAKFPDPNFCFCEISANLRIFP